MQKTAISDWKMQSFKALGRLQGGDLSFSTIKVPAPVFFFTAPIINFCLYQEAPVPFEMFEIWDFPSCVPPLVVKPNGVVGNPIVGFRVGNLTY